MSKPTSRHFRWAPILICWLLALSIFYLPQLLHADGVRNFTDNDDVMRMVTATDLANGQPWQDKIEHRDNVPFGSPMHWSRLVDAPIAGLLLALRPLVGSAAAINFAPALLPPLLLLGLLALSVGLTRRLLGPGHELPAALLPVLSIVVLGEFAPGRIDHHNWQMILTTGLVWATISGRTSGRAALAAGALAATSLAIGVETLPFIVAAVLAFSLFWVRDPDAAGNARRFALAFAGGTALHFLIATAPSQYFAAVCDELSAAYVVAAILVALAIVGATLLGRRGGPVHRLVLVGLLGGLATVVTLVLFPECRGGPYPVLSPRAFDLIMAHVLEAQPLWVRLATDPGPALSLNFASLAGVAVLGWACLAMRGEARVDWLVLLLFLGLAALVMVLQIRGARLAVMPAIPAGVWLIARARAAWRRRAGVGNGLGLVASWAVFASVLQMTLFAVVSEGTAKAPATAAETAAATNGFPQCFAPAVFARLATQPPGVVLAPMLIGPPILLYTPHGIVAAGFHRNVAGALDIDDFLNAGEAAARAIVLERGLTYVAACEGLAQLQPRATSAADSFVRLAAAGQHWNWLVPLSPPDERLQLFKIDLDR